MAARVVKKSAMSRCLAPAVVTDEPTPGRSNRPPRRRGGARLILVVVVGAAGATSSAAAPAGATWAPATFYDAQTAGTELPASPTVAAPAPATATAPRAEPAPAAEMPGTPVGTPTVSAPPRAWPPNEGDAAAPDQSAPVAPAAAASPAPPAPPPSAPVAPTVAVPHDAGLERAPEQHLDVSVGVGVSFDDTGTADGRTVAIPVFQATAGIGMELLGLEGRIASSQAAGRFHGKVGTQLDDPVDRLWVELQVAVRPLWPLAVGDTSWGARVMRAVTLTAGPGIEKASARSDGALRYGIAFGGHVNLPLTPSFEATDLRLRLGFHGFFGTKATVGGLEVGGDLGQAFAALAVAF